ncbi:hypothetical protein D9M72_490060 [compost metagenome]
MVGAFHGLAHPGVDVVIAAHILAGRNLLAAEAVEGGLGDDFAGEPQAAPKTFAVLLAVEIVEEDIRLLVRLRRAQPHITAALRLVRPRQHHETVTVERLLAVIAHGGRQKVELDIRPLEGGVGTNEAAALEMVGDRKPLLEE